MTEDDVLIPQEVRQLSPWAVVACILIGMTLALLFFYLLLLPARLKALNGKNNQELILYTEKLDAANRQLTELQSKNAELQSQYDTVQNQLTQYESGNAGFKSQYETLTEISARYQAGDMLGAAKLYASLDASEITDESLLNMYNEVKSYMEGNAYRTLAEAGTAAWNSGNFDQAVEYYTQSLALREEAENMFLLARLYQSRGETEQANALFDRIVGEHPDTPYAERARQARGY